MIFALSGEIARGEGKYQTTRDGKTLVWNSNPKRGDTATWSGSRDRNDYARGFGLLIWYEREPGSAKPKVYARYWGRMVNGKLEGPVNVHAKKKTHYALFIGGTRVTGWKRGTAPLRATDRWRSMVAKQQTRSIEPESPAAGPAEQMLDVSGQRSDDTGRPAEGGSIRDLYSERWPKIDIDDSLRLLAFPPRQLRR
jgi:hypothetical protein